MWDFLSAVFERGGFVALLIVGLVLLFCVPIYTLWKKNERLVGDLQKLYSDINALQERRVADAQSITERVVSHVENVDHTMEKVEKALDTLIQSRGKGR